MNNENMSIAEYFQEENIEKVGLTDMRLRAKILNYSKKDSSISRKYKIQSELETMYIMVFK